MGKSPIALFAYNRPYHLKRTIEYLTQNRLAGQSELFIFCDGPKAEASSEQLCSIAEVRKIAHSASGFLSIRVIESSLNKGLAASIISGVSQIVKSYGRVIVLEDDMETSPGFLEYMNNALDLYRYDERVMHVTGYMFPTSKTVPDTFFYEVPHCWGWATWDRAWQYFSNDIESLYLYWNTRWNEFNKWGGHDLQNQLTKNYEGCLTTWFVKWHAAVLQNNGLSLYPRESLVRNIGLDGSGENCVMQNDLAKHEEPLPESVDVVRIAIKENKRMARIIRVVNSGHWYSKRHRRRILSSIKNFFSWES